MPPGNSREDNEHKVVREGIHGYVSLLVIDSLKQCSAAFTRRSIAVQVFTKQSAT